MCNYKYHSCYHLTSEIFPIAQPERENDNGITSTLRLELFSRGPFVYGFSFNGWSPTIESSFGFSARSLSRPKTFKHFSRHGSDTLLTASGVSGKDAKTRVTRCIPAGHELTFLTPEFWHCRTNSVSIRLIRLLNPCVFPTQLSCVICRNCLV
jgi:hypothetical protein